MAGVKWWREPSAEALLTALLPPTVICAEQEGITITGLGMPQEEIPPDRALILSVTTLSAYQLPVARVFLAALDRRLSFAADVRERAETALQEAVASAVVHGNLAISSSGWGDFEFFRRLELSIERRLANRRLAYRRIVMAARWTPDLLSLSVRDQGRGADRDTSRGPDGIQGAADIRGMAILQTVSDSVTISERTRLVRMDFRR
jgi:phosphoserine phosphatase RsbU/P